MCEVHQICELEVVLCLRRGHGEGGALCGICAAPRLCDDDDDGDDGGGGDGDCDGDGDGDDDDDDDDYDGDDDDDDCGDVRSARCASSEGLRATASGLQGLRGLTVCEL